MPSAEEVTPNKWTEIEILFVNGNYSVIIGNFEGNPCLGERWNGDENGYGYPHQADKPLWHVVPQHFSLPILHKILDLHVQNSSRPEEQINNTIDALEEFQNRK